MAHFQMMNTKIPILEPRNEEINAKKINTVEDGTYMHLRKESLTFAIPLQCSTMYRYR